MKFPDHIRVFLSQMRTLPLLWLSVSTGSQLLLVALSYGLGATGLWLFFPPTHNAASMFLPIATACWLFRYRGLLVSMVLNGITFQLTYILLLRGLLSDSAFVEGGIIGFVTSFGIGLVVCWLRSAVDSAHEARQQVLAAEHLRLLTEFRERQAVLAYEQERQINMLKDQFIVNVSHELRTPLTVLTGFLELLAVHHEHLEPMIRAQMLSEVLASQEELISLVDRVLDVTRVMGDLPAANAKVVNVLSLLEDVLAHLAPDDLASYTVHLQVCEQDMVWADPQFLRQVLQHLFENIFKYVPRQTEISIEVTQDEPSSQVCLSVQDQGPGIPVDELPLLFEKFVRLKRDLTGSKRGTGLGLYICKQLVEAMGGRIWVESADRAGMGSRFCLTLPSVPAS